MLEHKGDSEAIRVSFLAYGAKIAATWLLCALVWNLWSAPSGQAALQAYVGAIGPLGISALVTTFFVAVGSYCRTRQRCLSLIAAPYRTSSQLSVWLMFLIPYNFIEDFFIVNKVASSLRREASTHPRLANFPSFGAWSGNGWCGAQILSLVPGSMGEAAGLAAIVVWGSHWHFILKVNRIMSGLQKLSGEYAEVGKEGQQRPPRVIH
jgi:hypothetical protein